MELQKATGFLKNAYYQGHGRYVSQIARLTIKFCKTGGSSREVRKFIETRLVDTARNNPGCVIYVKPRFFKTPVMTAEYLNGHQQYQSFYKMNCEQIEDWINFFISRNGADLYKLVRPTATYRTSVQGIWNPFTFRDPVLTTEELPNEDRGRCKPDLPSATDQVLEIFKRQAQLETQAGDQDQAQVVVNKC